MRRRPAKKLKQFSREATLVALTGLAFALGVGVGALAVTARNAQARVTFVQDDETATAELAAGREAWDLDSGAGVEAVAAEPDVHTVASALTLRLPSAVSLPTGPLYDPVTISRMVPGERGPAHLTFYYCSAGGVGTVGDGGGFCGRTADGTQVQPGVAACDGRYLGQKFRVVGDPAAAVFRCADTGGGVSGQHRDIWFPSPAEAGAWFASVGHAVTIEVLE